MSRKYLAALFFAGLCFGADAKAPDTGKTHFKLEFLVKEVDGAKVINTRSYTTMVAEGGRGGCEIRSGNKLQVPQNAEHTQYYQVDVGLNVDCGDIALEPAANELSLNVKVELSSVMNDASLSDHPMIRQNKWQSDVTVPLGKSTMLFTSDDMMSKHQMQFELMAKRVP